MARFLSRKFIVAMATLLGSGFVPIIYKWMGINDVITLAVLGVISSMAVGYGLINVKDANNALKAGVAAVETKAEAAIAESKTQ